MRRLTTEHITTQSRNDTQQHTLQQESPRPNAEEKQLRNDSSTQQARETKSPILTEWMNSGMVDSKPPQGPFARRGEAAERQIKDEEARAMAAQHAIQIAAARDCHACDFVAKRRDNDAHHLNAARCEIEAYLACDRAAARLTDKLKAHKAANHNKQTARDEQWHKASGTRNDQSRHLAARGRQLQATESTPYRSVHTAPNTTQRSHPLAPQQDSIEPS